MGAPTGNTNATKNKPWQHALTKALEDYNAGNGSKVEKFYAMKKMAEKLIDMALEGDIHAIKEIGDRVEGKATQALQHTGSDGGPIVMERHIVSPEDDKA